jgi:ABC-2 type transport system ATP-binding protein
MPEVIIKFQSVSKRYGTHLVLNNLNFEIYKGEIFGIIGASGAGKTTLLHTLIGFVDPEIGDVYFRPEHLFNTSKTEDKFKSIFDHQGEAKKLFGYASQLPSFYPKLTVYENLQYFGNLQGLLKDTLENNIKNLLKFMDLTESKGVLAENLSGGMQRRLDIGCAMIHDPKVLILDEPTADLDPILRHQLWNLIEKINKNGTTIILASHNLAKMENLCHRIAILHNKELIAVGKPDELKDGFSKSQEIELKTYPGHYEKLIKRLKERKDIEKIEYKGEKLVLITKEPQKVLHLLMHELDITKEVLVDISLEKPNLHDIFLSVSRNGKKLAKEKQEKELKKLEPKADFGEEEKEKADKEKEKEHKK